MKKRILVWFKNDLRLLDNEVLYRAAERAEEIVPVFCIDPTQFKQLPNGLRKTGSFRAQFLLESIVQLKNQLQERGGDLIVRVGLPEVEIPRIVKEYNTQLVYTKKEISPEELTTVACVEKALWKIGVEIEALSTSTLYHATDLPFGIKDIPDVFTAFRKKIERETQVRPPFPIPELRFPKLNVSELPAIEELGLPKKLIDNRCALPFKGGEIEALNRLDYYLFQSKAVQSYKETRNGLIGPDYSTKFSPWLAFGCISPKVIYHEIKRFENEFGENDSTYWVIFELIWRDYFRYMMKKYGVKMFQLKGWKDTQDVPNRVDERLFQAWINGETGDEFVDANMRELKLTGFMSNRGRQNVASFFVHELKLDWRLGAAYFEQQLIDYDTSSNYGNWAYVAGVGNDPRENRVFNTAKQAQQYDPKQAYRKLWLEKN
jgi:deoxyribodipyrimidine photo-lyase